VRFWIKLDITQKELKIAISPISVNVSGINLTYQSENKTKNDPQTLKEIAKLQAIDTKVKAHESAHRAAGGGFAGAASYTTVKGPDGKEYAVAGEVPIKIVKGNTPEETIKNMRQIKAAALAPTDPSPQDLKVAQTADTIAAKASQELSLNKNVSDDHSESEQYKIDIYA